MKLIVPEKHIAIRLHGTTSQPVNVSITSSVPSLSRKTADPDRLYTAYSLKNLRIDASGLFLVLSRHT